MAQDNPAARRLAERRARLRAERAGDLLVDPEEARRYTAAAAAYGRAIIDGEHPGPKPTPPEPDPARLADPAVLKQVEARERLFERRLTTLKKNVAVRRCPSRRRIVRPIGRLARARASRTRTRTRSRTSSRSTRGDPDEGGEPPGGDPPSSPALSFTTWHEVTRGLTGAARLWCFAGLPDELQDEAWRSLAADVERGRA